MPLKYLAFFALNCQWNEQGSLSSSILSDYGRWQWQQFKTWTATKTCQKSAHLKYLPQSPLRGSQPGRGRNCATWSEKGGNLASWARHLAAIWFSCLARRLQSAPHCLLRLCLATKLAPGCHSEFSLFVVCSWSPFIWLCACVCEFVCAYACCCHVRLSLFIFGSLFTVTGFCFVFFSFLLPFDSIIARQLLIDNFPAGPQGNHNTQQWSELTLLRVLPPDNNPTPISHRENHVQLSVIIVIIV